MFDSVLTPCRRLWLLVALAPGAGCSSPWAAPQNPAQFLPFQSTSLVSWPDSLEEDLEYRVRLAGLPVATLRCSAHHHGGHVVVDWEGFTHPWAAALVDLQFQMTSKIGPRGPHGFEWKSRENGRWQQRALSFGDTLRVSLQTDGELCGETTLEVDPEVIDPLSLLLALRTTLPDSVTDFRIALGPQIHACRVIPEGVVSLDTALRGPCQARHYRIEPRPLYAGDPPVIGPPFACYEVFFGEDDLRTPLQIRRSLPLGMLVAELTSETGTPPTH